MLVDLHRHIVGDEYLNPPDIFTDILIRARLIELSSAFSQSQCGGQGNGEGNGWVRLSRIGLARSTLNPRETFAVASKPFPHL